MANFRSKDTSQPSYPMGVSVYTDGSARERLTATLNRRLTREPTFEDRRAAEEGKAQETVRAHPSWANQTQLAVSVLDAAKVYARELAATFNNFTTSAFKEWQPGADEEFANRLLERTEAFYEANESSKRAFPKPARPFPVTSPDINSLAMRLGLLDNATPSEAKLQIEDGLMRGDIPYLVAAGANLRSWVDYRHTWKDSAAQKIANELTDKIDVATWTVDAYAAQFAADLADEYVDAWQFLISPIAAGNYTLDPSDIQTGALSPLLNPKPKKPANKKSPITFKNGEILVDAVDNITDNLSDDQTGE